MTVNQAAEPTIAPNPRAYLTRIDPSGENYEDEIDKGLDYIRFGDGLPTSPRVFLKPNLTYPTYRPGVMTSIGAIEAAIKALVKRSARITIGDADSGGYNPFSMDEVYKATGIAAFANKHGVKVVNLSRVERTAIRVTTHGRYLDLDLPKLLLDEIDTLITMPVPKVHSNTGVSLTFKNQWGCIPEPDDRLRLHPYFAPVIMDVNRHVHARYAIIDGRVGLNRSGPMMGEAVHLGWICVTNDLGAGARIACHLMQVNPAEVPHLHYAEKMGLLPALEDIDISGDVRQFVGPKFRLQRQFTDWPGYLAFHHSAIAHLAYFSRLAGFLHWALYLIRKPMYDYSISTKNRVRH